MRSPLGELAAASGLPIIEGLAAMRPLLGPGPEARHQIQPVTPPGARRAARRAVRSASCGEEKIFRLAGLLAAEYGEALVLYGGITATERIYGLKRIREITTDLDYACAPKGIGLLLERRGILYHPGYDILCARIEGLPVTFAFGHIHDWPIGEGFFAAAEKLAIEGSPALCCSREHAIMLKLRRMAQRLGEGQRAFGKDALDIINILAAAGARAVDIPVLARLILSEVPADPETRSAILRFIAGYEGHLTEGERRSFVPVLRSLAEALGAPGAAPSPGSPPGRGLQS